MIYQAIHTKYYGPTNYRGSRIRATAEVGSVTVAYNHAMDVYNNHRAAALALAEKYRWVADWVGGALPGPGYAFVRVG
jgi:hypothetical protein